MPDPSPDTRHDTLPTVTDGVYLFELQPKLATFILSCCHFCCANSVEIGARPRSVNSPPFRARMWNRPSEVFSSTEWPDDL